jgi:ATP-dependent DNA helicase RecG
MEEAIANAICHRSYEGPPEPVKIYLYTDRMEITSYPGPVPGIQPQHFEPGHTLPPVPARNRRIGDLLKELRLAEGHGTGIPKIRRRMRENGSPEARFDFDAERTYFRVTLPVHPRYETLNALRRLEQGRRPSTSPARGASPQDDDL